MAQRPGVKCQEAICEHLDEQYGPLLGNPNSASAGWCAPHVCAVHFGEPPILSLWQGVLAAGRRPAPPATASHPPPFSSDTRRPAAGELSWAADQNHSARPSERSEPACAVPSRQLRSLRLSRLPEPVCSAVGGLAGRDAVAWRSDVLVVPPVPDSACPRATTHQSAAPACGRSKPARADGHVWGSQQIWRHSTGHIL